MKYLLGIDLGTSSLRTVLIDAGGKILGMAGEEYRISVPRAEWAEQEPETWWRAVKNTIRKVLGEAKINPHDIKGIGLSGQMHGTVFMGKDGLVLRPAIIWPDNRSVAECNELNERIGTGELYKITGLPTATGFTAPSVMWIKKYEPDVLKDTVKILLPKDYIRYRLTGKMATDYTDATGTLFLDIVSRKWSKQVVEAVGINPRILPELLDSSSVAGEITRQAAKETDLTPGIPVIAGGGDQAMGAVGCGLIHDGVAASTIGTGGQLNVCVSKPVLDPKRRIHTLCHAVKNKWLLMGAVLSAGLSLRWFRDNLGLLEKLTGELSGIDPYEMLSKEAERVSPGAGGLLFLPYLSGDRTPHMDPHARGAFIGLTLQHGKSHLIRAVMEGVVFAMMDSYQVFKELKIPVETMLCSGGSARSPVWRQIQADIYGLPVTTVNIEEHSSFGAALLAGVGVNVFRSVEEACQGGIIHTGTTNPQISSGVVDFYRGLYQVYRSVYPKLKDIFPQLGKTV